MTRPMKITWLLLAMLAACDKLPPAPEAAAFAAMSSQAKCEATLPRAKRCVDELLVAEVDSLNPGGDPAFTDALREGMDKSPTYSDDAEAMHRTSCLASRDGSYTRGILRCWDTTPCRAFAECVYKTEAPRATKPTQAMP
jgi:hypothetical protein